MAAHTKQGFRGLIALLLALTLATSVVLADRAASGGWHTTGTMHSARAGHTATALADGRVLVAGGETINAPDFGLPADVTATAEIYDPGTRRWQSTGSMATPREVATATRLLDGRVLVAGGFNDTTPALSAAAIYDPATGRWQATRPMIQPRLGHAAV